MTETRTAGRELDAGVAEKVMGLRVAPDGRDVVGPVVRTSGIGWDAFTEEPVPHYSTDIAAAWEVVEKARNGGWFHLAYFSSMGLWRASFDSGDPMAGAATDTAPLAICLAALAAARSSEGADA